MAVTERPACPLWAKIFATGGGVGYIPFAPGTWGSLAAIFLLVVSETLNVHFMQWLNWHPVEMSINTVGDPGLYKYMYIDYSYPIGWFAFIIAGFFVVIGIPAGGSYAKTLQIKDPSQVVIDEFAGQTITLLGYWGHAPGFMNFLFAFILFRILDIWKPWPIRWFEKLPGGWGIMMDDVVAGIIGAVILAALVHFRWLPGM